MRKPLISVRFSIVVLMVLGLCTASAKAQGTPEDKSTTDKLQFVFAPYLWASGLSGEVGAFGAPPADIDASFSDILKNLDMTFMSLGEARYGPYGLYLDLVYVDLETDSTNTPGPFFSSAKVDSTLFFFTPMLEYRVFDKAGSSIDAMGGLRLWYSETELTLSGGLLNGRTLKDDATWVDPTIGVKGRLALSENWHLNGSAIIGGFGAGSHFLWDVFGGVNYAVSDWFSVAVGYRGMGVDYSNDGYVFDITMHGPVIGGVFRF